MVGKKKHQGMIPIALAVLASVLLVLPPNTAGATSPTERLKPTIRLLGGNSITAGVPVSFRLRIRVPTGMKVVRYRLDFGDGTTLEKSNRRLARAIHVYGNAGSYLITFTVFDSRGVRQHARLRVAVGTSSPAPGQTFTPMGSASSTAWPPPPPPPPPTPALPVFANWVMLPPGSVEAVEFSEDVLITGIDSSPPMPDGVTAVLEGNSVVVQVTAEAKALSTTLGIDATGCIEANCELHLDLRIPLEVLPLEAPSGWLYEFTSPSPDRLANGIQLDIGGTALTDELLVTLGSAAAPGSRSEAEMVAATVDGVVSGGLEGIGVYEIRWPIPQNIDARRNQLLGLPGVTGVSKSTVGLIGTLSIEPPGDWSDDGPQATWPFQQVRAGEAWDVTKGSSVTVGIVDEGLAYEKHEDLDVATSLYGHAHHHATHVAGLACAKANGLGLVGMAWGCPIVSSGVRSGADKHLLEAAEAVAGQAGVQVINISMGYPYRGPLNDRCATAQQQQKLLDAGQEYKTEFRHLFAGWQGRDIVWTIAAGNNCAQGAPGPLGANADLDNVITVAATNSDRKLASFSDFGDGVEIAAPGGVSVDPIGDGTVGVWSTWYKDHCWPLGFGCGSYAPDSGTSMAAPVVAGIAALVRAAHPSYDAVAAAKCITETAGKSTGFVTASSPLPTDGHLRHVTYSPATLPIVDAEAAVDCDTFGPIAESDYLGKWGTPGYGLEVFAETKSVLGVINEQGTGYLNGCLDPPGQKIFSQLTPQSNGQWSGNTIAITSDCLTHHYYPNGAMRIVRGSSGNPTLVLAWTTTVAGTSPTIDTDGIVTSSYSYYEMRLTRQESETTATASMGGGGLLGQSRGKSTTGAVLAGAVLRAATN